MGSHALCTTMVAIICLPMQIVDRHTGRLCSHLQTPTDIVPLCRKCVFDHDPGTILRPHHLTAYYKVFMDVIPCASLSYVSTNKLSMG